MCAAAGVTKGAFFHHFDNKEALAVEAVHHWSSTTGELFATAPYHDTLDPADRILGYLDLRASLIEGKPADYTCLAGTMVQEAFDTSPSIREACAESIFGHAETLEADIAAALANAGNEDVDAGGLARHTQAVLQGSFVLAKASNDAAVVLESIAHLRRYLALVFGVPLPTGGADHGGD